MNIEHLTLPPGSTGGSFIFQFTMDNARPSIKDPKTWPDVLVEKVMEDYALTIVKQQTQIRQLNYEMACIIRECQNIDQQLQRTVRRNIEIQEHIVNLQGSYQEINTHNQFMSHSIRAYQEVVERHNLWDEVNELRSEFPVDMSLLSDVETIWDSDDELANA